MPVATPASRLDRIRAALARTRQALLAERNPQGHWTGELATSALSTATAVSALALFRQKRTPAATDAAPFAPATPAISDAQLDQLIAGGVKWLAAHPNPDGGFGDTDKSRSNIATTLLVKAALVLAGQQEAHRDLLARADGYIAAQGGIRGLRQRYGRDKTFAVPILTNCALAGLVDWHSVDQLPFELACLPQSWFKFLELPVVSYALPALIAIGQVRFSQLRPWNPLFRFAREAAIEPSLRVLERIQPTSGGFLEATPLTSFVSMSLIGAGRHDHPVVRQGVKFLLDSVRPDGSWPIDTNLATWVTTLSINALAAAGEDLPSLLGENCLAWLRSCQHRVVHPYTGADPGGWAWTDLSGGVPDADDTPGALLALAHWLRSPGAADWSEHRARELRDAAGQGALWLLDLQNSDGGWPTFCRGWGALPFDRSGADLTAHALRALAAWVGRFAGNQVHSPAVQERFARFDARIGRARNRGLAYLARVQRPDGSWIPLWFGAQFAADEENPIFGTARVLMAYRDLALTTAPQAQRGYTWLAQAQNADGSWGRAAPAPGHPTEPTTGSIEETALAVEALLSAPAPLNLQHVINQGVDWLAAAVEEGRFADPAPIGFYFAKLWYYERMYPLVFIHAALAKAQNGLPPLVD